MNMFARFDENPAMNLQDIKETKHYGRTHGQRENSIPPTNKVCGGYNYFLIHHFKLKIWVSHCDGSFEYPQHLICLILFDLIYYVPVNIFKSYWDGTSWVEPVLCRDYCVLLKDTT